MSAVAERTSEAATPASAAAASSAPGTCSSAGCATLIAGAGQPVLIEAQQRWAACPLAERLQVLRRARHAMAARPELFAQAISPLLHRSQADTLVTELLPLLDAMRFLERRARRILATRKLGNAGRPMWLGGVQAEIHRVPLGHILVIGPANFPLFLPAVQVVQALAAGNAVTWKPGRGGQHIGLVVAGFLREAGLPRGVLSVTGEGVEDAGKVLATHPDKVVFTGSLESGRKVLHTLADTATPSVMELSGADAVVVLPSANLPATAKAIAFGVRLNGAEVCMSPRRLVATQETMLALRPLLEAELAKISPVSLPPHTAVTLRSLLEEAVAQGASLQGAWTPEAQRPLWLWNAKTTMAITRSDVFAPVISVIEAPSVLHISAIVNDCPYALTAAVFGEGRAAKALGNQLRVGTVLVNDLIAPTADPRVPFGGRGQSGFGATRGAEGLLEMTAAKSVLVRRRMATRHYAPVGAREVPLFAGLIGLLHGGSLGVRLRSMRAIVASARKR